MYVQYKHTHKKSKKIINCTLKTVNPAKIITLHRHINTCDYCMAVKGPITVNASDLTKELFQK